MRLTDTLPPPNPPAPGSDVRRLYESRGWPFPTVRRVWATRRMARDVLAAQPEQPDVLDFEGVEVASTPFLHELRKTWRTTTATNMNEDVAASWEMVTEPFEGRS